jgi:hypothetical protein
MDFMISPEHFRELGSDGLDDVTQELHHLV